VAHDRLDIYTQFLLPVGVKPKTKAIESLDIMVQMVGLGRGVTVLPDWLAKDYCQHLPVSIVRLGKQGLAKTLFAVMRQSDVDINYMKMFVKLGKQSKDALNLDHPTHDIKFHE
jgi:LysR family transcriptional regulator for metE and metH